jgi:hypothetical protein
MRKTGKSRTGFPHSLGKPEYRFTTLHTLFILIFKQLIQTHKTREEKKKRQKNRNRKNLKWYSFKVPKDGTEKKRTLRQSDRKGLIDYPLPKKRIELSEFLRIRSHHTQPLRGMKIPYNNIFIA